MNTTFHRHGEDDDQPKKEREKNEQSDPRIGKYTVDERAGEGHDPIEDEVT